MVPRVFIITSMDMNWPNVSNFVACPTKNVDNLPLGITYVSVVWEPTCMRPVPDRSSVRSVVGSIAMPCTRNGMMGTVGFLNETRPPPVLIVSRFEGLAMFLPMFAMFLNVAQKLCPSRFGCRVHHGSCIAILSWMSRAMRFFAILVSVTSSVFPLLQVLTHRLLCPDSNQR